MSGSNTKVFTGINRAEHDAIIQNLRTKRWTLPAGDTGFVRAMGLFADWTYNEKETTISMRIRECPKGETYPSIFGQVEELVRKIDR